MGSKPGKTRPCLAIQPDLFGEGGLTSTVLIPITSKLIGEDAYPLRIRLPKGICQLEKESELLVDQILAWDNSFIAEDLGELPVPFHDRVKKALREFLDLD